jgi:AcrR family transcriptional regulator
MMNGWGPGGGGGGRGARRAPGRAAARWRRAPSRTEKSERIRRALLAAAADVVGEVGYADASISLITQRAGVAQGTFYNYFDSRQDIFDQLLPTLGAQMLAHVAEQAHGGKSFAELEERSFVAFFSYLKKSPRFFRVLNEAENFAPKAYRQHFDVVSRRYLAFLKRSHRNREFPAFTEQELEVVVFVLMAARSYIALRYASAEHGQHGIPEWVVRAYMKLILHGLQGRGRSRSPASGRGRQGTSRVGPR